jgi:uncharacterized protein (TIGR03790 family)
MTSSLLRFLPLSVAILGLVATLMTPWSARAADDAQTPSATEPAPAVPAPATEWSVPSVYQRQWFSVPKVTGRLTVSDLGLVINTEDPYSVQVGEAYAKARGVPDSQVLRVSLPIRSALTRDEFAALSKKIDRFYGDRVQALALTWRMPYAVECNAITGALAMGFDAGLCTNTCAVSRTSRYYGSASTRPYADFKMRLAMMLAAPSVDAAKALITRGIKADGSLAVPGALPANVHLVTTSDKVRSVREVLFPPAGPIKAHGLQVSLDKVDALRNPSRVLMYLTGATQVDFLDTVDFLPGALADHLTSFGGVLDKPHGQMSVLSWIDAGATASYGTASEPCAHLQKFPHPQGLILFYAQGATAIETYWKSVAWPQQGLFVGEPLAAPFDRGGKPGHVTAP